MSKYLEALKRPFTDLKKLAIVFLLFLVPIINMIAGIFASGYFLECANSAMKKKKKLPEWKNWGDLFVKGITALVISIIYFIPSLILLIISIVSYLPAFKDFTPSKFTYLPPIPESMIPILIATIIVLIITSYVMPAVVMMFAKNYKFKEAFDWGKIFPMLLKLKYLSMMLFVLIFVFLISSVSQLIINLIGEEFIIPIIFGAFVNAFTGITIYTIYGSFFTELSKN